MGAGPSGAALSKLHARLCLLLGMIFVIGSPGSGVLAPLFLPGQELWGWTRCLVVRKTVSDRGQGHLEVAVWRL